MIVAGTGSKTKEGAIKLAESLIGDMRFNGFSPVELAHLRKTDREGYKAEMLEMDRRSHLPLNGLAERSKS